MLTLGGDLIRGDFFLLRHNNVRWCGVIGGGSTGEFNWGSGWTGVVCDTFTGFMEGVIYDLPNIDFSCVQKGVIQDRDIKTSVIR